MGCLSNLSRNLSAGGQLEHPSDVNSSTSTGVRGSDPCTDSEPRARIQAVIESAAISERSESFIRITIQYLLEVMHGPHESYARRARWFGSRTRVYRAQTSVRSLDQIGHQMGSLARPLMHAVIHRDGSPTDCPPGSFVRPTCGRNLRRISTSVATPAQQI